MVDVIESRGHIRVVRDKTLGVMQQRICPLCSDWYFYDRHRYDATKIRWADTMICNDCYRNNYDGFNDHDGAILQKLAESKGLPIPRRNAKDWLPRN